MSASRGLSDEPIENYLDELMTLLRLPPRAARHLLQETEDHLRTSAEAAERDGESRPKAERDAVARFGTARQIADQAHRSRRRRPVSSVGELVWSATALAGVGLAAVGASGVLAILVWAAGGRQFIGQLPAEYADYICEPFVTPHATSCAQAAMLGDRSNAIVERLAVGLLGLLLLAAARLTRRYLSSDPSSQRMLAAGLSIIAAVSFAAVALALLGDSIDDAVRYGSIGIGWNLSGAIISLVGTVAAGANARRHTRYIRIWNHAMVEI